MRGGYRQNAGRKKGFSARKAEEARRILSEMLTKEIKPIAEALILKAKKGDISAIKELFDRSWGKAAQAFDVTLGEENELEDTSDAYLSQLAKKMEQELKKEIMP